jgi:hypothetical protein
MRALFSCVVLAAACSDVVTDDDGGWDFSDGKSDGTAISYAALAAAKLTPAFDTSLAGLSVVDGDVMPHEPKVVRKQLAELRDHLDLFAYAYTTKHGDLWRTIRKDVDEGYETIGAFKDLFDLQGLEDPALATYEPGELAERRDAVIAWTDAYRASATAYRAHLAVPSSKMFDRDRDDLSPYFWAATDLEPSSSKSGLKNIALLARELADLAKADYDEVLDVRDLHLEKNQEAFHAFRKRVRGLARLPGYFTGIVKTGSDLTATLVTIADGVERYGALNDKLTAYFHDPSNARKKEIAADWKALRDWQKVVDFGEVIDDLHDAIRK